MDNETFFKLKILEDETTYVTDVLVNDSRIEEDIRKEYGKWIREVLYSGVDEMVDRRGYSMNFK